MKHAKDSAWTDALVEEIAPLFTQGQTATQLLKYIFETHGIQLSRSAVSAKLSRLGLKRPPRETKVRAPRVRRQPQPRENVPSKIRPYPFTPRIVDVSPLNLLFAELTDNTCKWECTDAASAADFRFCGHKPLAGLPYCAKHCGIAYLPPRIPVKEAA